MTRNFKINFTFEDNDPSVDANLQTFKSNIFFITDWIYRLCKAGENAQSEYCHEGQSEVHKHWRLLEWRSYWKYCWFTAWIPIHFLDYIFIDEWDCWGLRSNEDPFEVICQANKVETIWLNPIYK